MTIDTAAIVSVSEANQNFSRVARIADKNGEAGVCPALRVDVVDTTGAGDAFFAGVAIGLTYGKTVGESCVIGTRLAASVIASSSSEILRASSS